MVFLSWWQNRVEDEGKGVGGVCPPHLKPPSAGGPPIPGPLKVHPFVFGKRKNEQGGESRGVEENCFASCTELPCI